MVRFPLSCWEQARVGGAGTVGIAFAATFRFPIALPWVAHHALDSHLIELPARLLPMSGHEQQRVEISVSSKHSPDWQYEPRPRKITVPRDFEAWIAATDLPNPPDSSPGTSAHAWEIRQTGSGSVEDSDTVASDSAESGEWRGYVSAVFRVVEALPDNSNVTIICGHKPLVDAINEWASSWRDDDWRKSDGDPVEHQGIWKRYFAEHEARNIRVKATLLRSELDRERVDRLREEARVLCGQRSRALGSSGGGFETVPGAYVGSSPKRRKRRRKL